MSSYWRRSLPEWVPSLEAGNQSEQGLYLFLVPDAIEIYQAQNRNMNYCIVDVLIDRALYYFSQGTLEQAQSELSQAEKICIDNDYAGEKKLIDKIRSQQDSSELHTLNFP